MKTDADVIAALMSGLAGPIDFLGNMYCRMRISGTGVAWREGKQEFCFRDPKVWLTDEMAARWIGVPVVVRHPVAGVLDGDELSTRVVGTVVRAFVAADELLGVTRIINQRVAGLLREFGGDTSPSVLFAEKEVAPIVLKTGERVLIERAPILVDHLAIVAEGVWSRGLSDAEGVGI